MSDFEYDYLSSLAKRNAVLLCKSVSRRDYLRLLAQIYQVVIVSETIEDEVENNNYVRAKSDQVHAPKEHIKIAVDLLLLDFTSNMEINQQELSHISSYIMKHQIEAVVWATIDDLDELFAQLPASQCHFLIDSNPLEAMPALTGLTGREVMSHLSDISQDESNEKEYAALHRISSELASLAKTLAEIAVIEDMNISETKKPSPMTVKSKTHHDDYLNHSVFKDKPISFNPFPNKASSAPSPFIDNGDKYPIQGSSVSAELVRGIIKQRRMRDNYFESALFADPAWDILLDLMAARLSGQTVSVSSLCIAAAVPATTALRWITSMTKNGMLERKSDPMDARRVFIDLSDESYAKLETYLTKAVGNGGPII